MGEPELEVCKKLKHLGYARSKHIRLYGEQFQLVSDPFPHETGIAIEVVKRDNQDRRTLRLPLPILKMAMPKSA